VLYVRDSEEVCDALCMGVLYACVV